MKLHVYIILTLKYSKGGEITCVKMYIHANYKRNHVLNVWCFGRPAKCPGQHIMQPIIGVLSEVFVLIWSILYFITFFSDSFLYERVIYVHDRVTTYNVQNYMYSYEFRINF